MTIKVTAHGLRELAKKYEGRAKALDRELKRGVTEAAMLVWADARDRKNWAGLLDNPKPSAEYLKKSHLKKMTVAQAARRGNPLPPPGPLRVITGMLLRSYARRVERQNQHTWVGIVGSRLKYARPHELGGTWTVNGRTIHMPARPVLGPALERQRSKAMARISEAVRRGLNG